MRARELIENNTKSRQKSRIKSNRSKNTISMKYCHTQIHRHRRADTQTLTHRNTNSFDATYAFTSHQFNTTRNGTSLCQQKMFYPFDEPEVCALPLSPARNTTLSLFSIPLALALIHTHSQRSVYPPTSPFSMSMLSTAKSVLFAPFQYCGCAYTTVRVPSSTYNISLYKENITFIYWISHQWTFFIFNAFSCYSWNFFYFWHESPGEITFDEHMYTFFEYIKIIWILCQSE